MNSPSQLFPEQPESDTENDRWWQVYCAVLGGFASRNLNATPADVAYAAAEWAEAAIEEAENLSRL